MSIVPWDNHFDVQLDYSYILCVFEFVVLAEKRVYAVVSTLALSGVWAPTAEFETVEFETVVLN